MKTLILAAILASVPVMAFAETPDHHAATTASGDQAQYAGQKDPGFSAASAHVQAWPGQRAQGGHK